jgi:tetratricopeptide (TPR) repeat protein
MGYYWVYYLAVLLAYWAIDKPIVLLAIVGFIVFRRWIPDPWVLLRTFGRIRALREQIAANPANVTARRDLARIYLDRLRPRAALALIDEARERDEESSELLYLRGVALHRIGRNEDALEPLVDAVDRDKRSTFCEPYLIAGDALTELGRHDEAIDAYERFVEKSTSSIEGWTKLALAHNRAGEKAEAKTALSEANATWRQIPGYRRRAELGWFLRAQLYRMFI